MRKSGKLWEYVAVYMNDLAFVVRDPARVVKELEDTYKYKLKGTGSVSFRLGYDLFRDEDVTLFMAPRKHIEKLIDGYKSMLDKKTPNNFESPLEKGDHPELYNTKLLDPSGVRKFQSLSGSIQWEIQLED